MSYVFAGKYVARNLTGPVSVLLHGTVTPATLYTDRTKATGAPNPAMADASGHLTIWAAPGEYDIVDSAGDVASILVQVDPADVPVGPSSNPFATVTDVTNRLGDTANPGDTFITAALDDASSVVRTIAQKAWANPATAPGIAKTITLRLVLTAIRNPEHFVGETDGDYSYTRDESLVGPATPGEAELILLAAGRGGLASVQVERDIYVDVRALGLVGVIGGGDEFPLGVDPFHVDGWTPGDTDVNVIIVDDGFGSDFG